MNHTIWVEVKTFSQSRVLVKLFKNQINVLQVEYLKDGLRFQIDISDYKKLKKIVGYRFRKVKDGGVFALFTTFKQKWLVLLGILLFFLLLFFFSHIMVSVDVIHSSKDVRDLVTKALDEKGIRRLTFKKSFEEIEQIKKEILNDHPNELEWLEIEVVGMKYIVRIEERILTSPEEKKERCHLVATKSAIVKKLLFSSGEAKVQVNDFVKEGDILVSGELLANEKVTGEVCATGDVYGEVWYTVKLSLPLNYEETKETGKTRWNFGWSKGDLDGYILRPRLGHFVDDKTYLFTIFNTSFSFLKQKEVEVNPKTYTYQEAEEKALSLAEEKVRMKLQAKEEILSKKVLKKQVNDSTMDIEIFVSVLEHISRQEEFQKIEEG